MHRLSAMEMIVSHGTHVWHNCDVPLHACNAYHDSASSKVRETLCAFEDLQLALLMWLRLGKPSLALRGRGREIRLMPQGLQHAKLSIQSEIHPADCTSIGMCGDGICDAVLQIVKETLPALVKLKKQGIVRHIGITGLPLKIYQYVIDRYVVKSPGSSQLCPSCIALVTVHRYLQSLQDASASNMYGLHHSSPCVSNAFAEPLLSSLFGLCYSKQKQKFPGSA